MAQFRRFGVRPGKNRLPFRLQTTIKRRLRLGGEPRVEFLWAQVPALTMNVYTDPALLDVRGALDALPTLSLDHDKTEAGAAGRPGQTGLRREWLHQPLHQLLTIWCNQRQSLSNWQMPDGRRRRRDRSP